MNMFKSNGGFTLVELIVVIAILAILAGVAVPAYSGYIAKANDAAVLSELKAMHTAAQSLCAMDGTYVTEITASAADSITVKAANGNTYNAEALKEFYQPASNLATLIANHSSTETSATWKPVGGWNLIEND